MKKKCYQVVKRIFDIVAALMGIVVTLPIWFVAIIGITISDRGPIFYMAKRVGKNGQIFRMYKFRSMRVDNNANENNFKADQNRIFKFGDIMRRTKIDELPQLLNILQGQMSVVGPRPASVDQVDIVRAGENSVVNTVLPGLTGPSALYDYLYGDSIEDETEYEAKVLPTRLALDVVYVNHMNAKYDVKMIWYTIVCIFNTICKQESTYILEKIKC